MKRWDISLILLAVGFLFGCSPVNTPVTTEEPRGCKLILEDFSEDDLIGTWHTGWSKRNDTLILQEDGLYKQIMYVENPPFEYESEWQSWWVEIGDNRIPYLHLEGMRMCVYWSHIDCEDTNGGDTLWRDYCRNEWVRTPNEGVLMVFGDPYSSSLSLMSFTKATVGGVTGYELQEP